MSATPAIVEARRAHSARCRQRVIKALNDAVTQGEEISVSAISRKAGVDRSFFYRHRDLHAQVMAKAAEPPASPSTTASSSSGCLSSSASRRGSSQDSAHPPTSTPFSSRSPDWISRSSNCTASSPNVTRNWKPPVPPTASSSPGSTAPATLTPDDPAASKRNPA